MKITGADALQKRLNRLATLADVQNVIKKHGTQMQQGAMRKAPVDTGFLKRSITLSMEDGGLTARVGSNAKYASFVEYGTRFQSAQSFLRPSFYEQRNRLQADLRKIMK